MKRFISYLLPLVLSSTLMAGGEEKPLPISIFADSTHIAPAKFRHPHNHHHLTFSESRAVANYTHTLNDTNGLSFGTGYLGTKFHFSKHPKFKQRHFDNALFNIGGFTKEAENWFWDANLNVQMNTEHFSLSRYAFFTGLLHGQYRWHSNRNLHVGFIGYTGLRYSRMLPIIGFDYKMSQKWKFNAVFPLNVSAVYSINNHWSIETGLRYFLTRQRLGKDENLRRGFVAYRGLGAEIGLNYRCNDHIYLNAHVGESLSSRMRVSNHNDHHRRHYKMGPAPYVGVMAMIAF